MRLRHGARGAEKPALVDNQGRWRDLRSVLPDIDPAALAPPALQRLRELDVDALPLVEQPGPLALPWAGMGKFIAIGLNYADHAAESGLPVPKEPVVFSKAISCAVGANHAVVLPQGSVKADWEVELHGKRPRPPGSASAQHHVDDVVVRARRTA